MKNMGVDILGFLGMFNKEYTVQYQVIERDEVVDTDRLNIKAGDHAAARKKADTMLRKQFGRTQYKIEWVQRF